jgi:hypothetical protein
MSESAERVKVGEERAGQACVWCKISLGAEDDAAVCTECGALHHVGCWDGQLGCGTAGCANAPLKRLDTPEPGRAGVGKPKAAKSKGAKLMRRADMKTCVDCGAVMALDEEVCDSCYAINTPDGLYHGPRTNAPGAGESLAISLVAVFICAPILSPMAISRALKAKEAMRRDPRLGGGAMATAGLVIGIIGISLWVIGFFSKILGTGR